MVGSDVLAELAGEVGSRRCRCQGPIKAVAETGRGVVESWNRRVIEDGDARRFYEVEEGRSVDVGGAAAELPRPRVQVSDEQRPARGEGGLKEVGPEVRAVCVRPGGNVKGPDSDSEPVWPRHLYREEAVALLRPPKHEALSQGRLDK